MSDYFYLEQPIDGIIRIPSDEARHLVKALRKKEGDKIFLTDGKGTRYTAELTSIDYDNCHARVVQEERGYGRRNYRLHIAIAPTKNMDRLEWFVEKATEIGVDEITPMICSRSERKELRTDRLVKIAIAAMKQSGQAYLPHINDPVLFPTVVAQSADQRFVCHLSTSEPKQLSASCSPGGSILLLVGPEGDFTEDELRTATGKGFRCVALGGTRLRTETAGITACTTISIINL